MVFSLMAEGLSVGALVALIIVGVVVLAFAVFGIVLKARETSVKTKRVKKVTKSITTPTSTVVIEEKHYDFTNLSEEEKDLIRKHRDSK